MPKEIELKVTKIVISPGSSPKAKFEALLTGEIDFEIVRKCIDFPDQIPIKFYARLED